MSLNNIELGDLIVSELYRDSLLATEKPFIPVHPVTTRPSSPIAEGTTAEGTGTPTPGQPPASISSQPAPPAVSGQETSPSAKVDPTPAPPAATGRGLGSLAAAVHGRSTPTPPDGKTPGTDLPVSSSPGSTSSIPGPGTPASSHGTIYKFLGNNRRNITILVQSPGVAFLPDDQLSFLSKMLEACKMNMGDVAIVNQATTPINITTLKQQLQPTTLLLFGMEPVDIRLPMNFPAFKIQDYDGCTYLCASSLEELVRPGDESKLLKSKLWICLKTIFGI